MNTQNEKKESRGHSIRAGGILYSDGMIDPAPLKADVIRKVRSVCPTNIFIHTCYIIVVVIDGGSPRSMRCHTRDHHSISPIPGFFATKAKHTTTFEHTYWTNGGTQFDSSID